MVTSLLLVMMLFHGLEVLAVDIDLLDIEDPSSGPKITLTEQAELPGGTFGFGSQLAIAGGKLLPGSMVEGASARKEVTVSPFLLDTTTVTNRQFAEFVKSTGYTTESETFGWSFVFEGLLQRNEHGAINMLGAATRASKKKRSHSSGSGKSNKTGKGTTAKAKGRAKAKESPFQPILDQVQDLRGGGLGRVNTSTHWLAVRGANWFYPFGQLVAMPARTSGDGDSSNNIDSNSNSDTGNDATSTASASKSPPSPAPTVRYTDTDVEIYNEEVSVHALGLWDHPAVHVTYNDAVAYCQWAGEIEVEQQRREKEEKLRRELEALEDAGEMASAAGSDRSDSDDIGADVTVDGNAVLAPKKNTKKKTAKKNSGSKSASEFRRRLASEHEWEFAARGKHVNLSYPWGEQFKVGMMNVWELRLAQTAADNDRHTSAASASATPKTAAASKAGSFNTAALRADPERSRFPHIASNSLEDGHLGVAAARSFPPNAYGLYNMLGNVWEWVAGGTDEERVLRGGSFVDSTDGSFNHIVLVSTRQINTGDSSASNIGFRCAKSLPPEKKSADSTAR